MHYFESTYEIVHFAFEIRNQLKNAKRKMKKGTRGLTPFVWLYQKPELPLILY